MSSYCYYYFLFITGGDVNSLSMEVGDVLDIMEEDTGDGWTRVRKGDNEGFVPTTYLEFDS